MEKRAVKYWGSVKQTPERNVMVGLAAYELAACLPGSPLPPFTRFIANNGVLLGVVFGVLAHHFHKHRK